MAAVMLHTITQSSALNKIFHLSPGERLLYGALAVIAYLFLASSLRFRRRLTLQDKYPYRTRESMSEMTHHDAWAIQKTILQMEFPFIVLKSLQFALFRVGTSHIKPTTHPTIHLTKHTTDLRNPNYINPSSKNLPILRLSNFIQALRRHGRFNRRIHGLRPTLRTGANSNRQNKIPAQGIQSQRQDSRR